MKLRQFVTVFIVLASFLHVDAQVKSDERDIIKSYQDSLKILRARIDSMESVNRSYELDNFMRFRLFTPATFYHSVANGKLSFSGNDTDIVNQEVDNSLMNIYLANPQLVRISENRLIESRKVRDVSETLHNNEKLVEKVLPKPKVDIIEAPVEVVVTKPNFWTFNGDYSLQMTQFYVSGNWYKGGESNYSVLGAVTMEANYNNKQKVKWENKLEMKLGLMTSESDTIHKLKSTEDLLRLTSSLEFRAHKRWYYTLQLLAYTQFYPGYKSNDRETYSDFLSPFNLTLSLGMTYNVEAFNKRLKGSVQLAPLAYSMRYSARRNVAIRQSIGENHHSMDEIGMQTLTDLTWKFTDDISWKTRLYGFTSFSRALVEWENTINLRISRFLSTNIFVYPRFDDSVARDNDYNYFQLKEYFSLGISYSF